MNRTSSDLGAVWMATTIALWSTFALAMQAIGDSTLTTLDAGLLRFGVAAIVLTPMAVRALPKLRRTRPLVLLGLSVGAGLPHFWLAEIGGHSMGAAVVGIVLPGLVPAFIAIVRRVVQRRVVSKTQWVSMFIISAGVALAAATVATGFSVVGFLSMCTASLLWALFTFALAETKLTALETAWFVSSTNAVFSMGVMTVRPNESHIAIGAASIQDIAIATLVLGIGTGVLSSFAYTTAVRMLGSRDAAAYGALTPVLSVAGAVLFFSTTITTELLAGLVLVVFGVLTMNGAVRRPTLATKLLHSAS